MSGIYIHIPFCKQACNYCDFHFSTFLKNRVEIIKGILNEIDLRQDYLKNHGTNLSSIYFGGGTPSLLNQNELLLIFEALGKYFLWDRNIEITLEANPDDIDRTTLMTWKNFGINRLSIGLQSVNDEELKWMNRAHTAEESISCVKLAQDNGFGNLSLDLIYGSKFQNIQSWEQTLTKIIELQPQHISAYNLTIEKKTKLGLQRLRGLEPLINEDLSSAQFLMMLETLEKAGFIHYEISNFGKPGFFAKHNSNYWLQQPYLGLGPSAHSFNGNSRQWNVRNNNLYINALKNGTDFFEREYLQPKDLYNEYVLTRLRTIWGCSIEEIETKYGRIFMEHFKNEVAKKTEYLELKNGTYTLNKAGKLMADGIASDLFFL